MILQSLMVLNLTLPILIVLFKFKLEKDDYSKSTNELGNKFQRKHFLVLFLFFILLPTFTYGSSTLFNWLSNTQIKYDSSVIYIIKPGLSTWITLGMMYSLGCSVFAILIIARLLFKGDESNYWHYYNRKYNFSFGLRATSLLKYLGIVLILSSIILVSFNLNTFVRFKKHEIEISSFSSFQKKRYAFESVKNIIHYQKTIAPNGNVVHKPHYAIVFDNDNRWRTNDNLRTPGKNDDKIFAFLADKTGLTIEEIEIDK